jgi:hypothetical protein
LLLCGVFDGWCRRVRSAGYSIGVIAIAATATPRLWLLRIGWRRGGLLHPDYDPGRALH